MLSFLERVVSEDGISTDPDNIKTVQDWHRPKHLIQWSGYDFKVFSHISCNRSKDKESPLICLGVFGLGQS
jgi:hypothetical protein